MKVDDLSNYRSEFPITEHTAFLSHAAVSPLSRRAAAAVRTHLERAQHESFFDLYNDIMSMIEDLKQRIATLINAKHTDEIVPMPNTATGINTVANSLPLTQGDNVLLLDGDYPANIYPWQNLAHRGILTKIVPQHEGGLDVELLKQHIDHRTRVVAISTVMFASGFRNDIATLGTLCKELGLFFAVDGIQSLGAFPIDVQACHIDFLSSGSQKWLLSTPGSGFLYCRRERLDELTPGAYVGAASVVDPHNYLNYNLSFPHTAERFNIGTPNILGMVALHAALGLILEIGIDRISQQILRLVEALIDNLSGRGFTLAASTRPQHRSGIVVAKMADAETVCAHLAEEGFVVTARGSGVRIAPHFYNTLEEVHGVVQAMDRRSR